MTTLLSIPELTYVALIFGLFVIPRLIARLYIPPAITALLLGTAAAYWTEGLESDVTLKMMSLFGITSLFLFAGLDVDVQQIKENYKILIGHVLVFVVTLAGIAYAFIRFFDLPLQQAALLSLALLTPSCGFIFDSLEVFGLSADEKFWVKSKAVATEIVALIVMIFALQSGSHQELGVTVFGLSAMVIIVPFMFRFFAKVIAPYAQGSEFAFLLMTAILCATITRRLGAYYLVGAFFVGAAAHQFEKLLPATTAENTLHAMRVFANFFIPFYFFKAGMEIHASDFSLSALYFAVLWLGIIIPLRVLSLGLYRKLTLKQPFAHGKRVGYALLPTLVFGLVIAGLLREKFHILTPFFGALIIYTVAATMMPTLLLKAEGHLKKPALPENPT